MPKEYIFKKKKMVTQKLIIEADKNKLHYYYKLVIDS